MLSELMVEVLDKGLVRQNTSKISPVFNENHSKCMDACWKYAGNRAGEIWFAALSEIQLKK